MNVESSAQVQPPLYVFSALLWGWPPHLAECGERTRGMKCTQAHTWRAIDDSSSVLYDWTGHFAVYRNIPV